MQLICGERFSVLKPHSILSELAYQFPRSLNQCDLAFYSPQWFVFSFLFFSI